MIRSLSPLAAALLVTAAALALCHSQGWTLYYGDAAAHLNIARRLVDTRTPGYEQIGTVWLPLPHWILALLARHDGLWQSGLAGAIPAALSHAAAGWLLFASARRLFASAAAGWAALLVFLLNPNALYLGVIPMTEPFFAAALGTTLYCTIHRRAAAAGVAACAAAMIRYEGWFLIPFFALTICLRQDWRAAARFTALASLGPLYWLAHNRWLDLDWLLFYRGPYSAKAIQGGAAYPGSGDWIEAGRVFLAAARGVAGTAATAIAAAGAMAALWLRRPVVLILAAAPAFYVINVHGGDLPLYVPSILPHSYYNTRYALSILPLAALGAAALVSLAPARWRAAAALGLAATAALPRLVNPTPDAWLCWKESEVNSAARRRWSAAAARYLADRYRGGDILSPFGDLTTIHQQAGIPLARTIHDGNRLEWIASVHRPELFLNAEWVVTMAGDAVDRAAASTVGRYELVHVVTTQRAPQIRIYRWRARKSR